MAKPTLVIGDVHGHFDRLEALLLQEGVIGRCPNCNGTGDIEAVAATFESAEEIGQESQIFRFDVDPFCGRCDGEGTARINFDVDVVQLGDLGHWGGSSGSPTGDKITWEHAHWLDTILWGNHDRALVDWQHVFGGYQHPGEVKALVDRAYGEGRLKMAAEAHGYLLVHAGVSRAFKHLAEKYVDAKGFAAYLNSLDQQKIEWLRENKPRFNGGNPAYFGPALNELKRFKVIDAIGPARGGRHTEGGVLWMDWTREKHLEGKPFKFICGHTADKNGLFRNDDYGNWCIDIGGKKEARLGGLWLEADKEPRMVRVDL